MNDQLVKPGQLWERWARGDAEGELFRVDVVGAHYARIEYLRMDETRRERWDTISLALLRACQPGGTLADAGGGRPLYRLLPREAASQAA